MQLPKGSTLGSYRIEKFVASGGMGEIYKARHTELDRWVAIKILGEGIGRDEVALRRFRREAKSASRLEHPHICRVYDFGEDGDRAFLVLEYLEGETLAERTARGPLSHEEILEFGAEIAEALDHAHSHGLVHRDLKPDNVMLTKSGTKVLDFGIAKRSAPSDAALGSEVGGTTRDTRTLTREGAIIGTLPYMAPEQVGGGDADARTDIYALGVMLYQLIAGRLPVEGLTQAALAVAILRDSPENLQTVDPSISASLARVVHRCLEKDPEKRWQTARDLGSEMRWLLDSGGEAEGLTSGGVIEPKFEFSAGRLGLGVALMVAVVAAVVALRETTVGSASRMMNMSLIAPPGTVFSQNHQDAAVSPDGETVLLVGVDSIGRRLFWSKSLFDSDYVRLDVEEGAHAPFWSPDGSRIGYFMGHDVRFIDLNSDEGSVILADVSLESRGGSWGRDDVVLVSPGPQAGILRTSPGAAAEVVTIPDRSRGEIGHLWPYFLPDGRQFLYFVHSSVDTVQGIYVASLEAPAGRRILSTSSSAAYANGHILFLRDRRLLAQAFDPQTAQLQGTPVRLVDDVATTSTFQAAFSPSRSGVLVYSRGDLKDVTELVWYDREGRRLGTVGEPGRYRNPSLSRDGRYLAVESSGEAESDIWISDLISGRGFRTNASTARARDPVWTVNSLGFTSQGTDGWAIYRWDMNRTDPPELLLRSPAEKIPTDWSPDGRTLLYAELTSRGDYDIVALELETGEPKVLFGNPYHELTARFSPSGRFVAYGSNESSEYEVYVEPFPPTGLKCQISSNGGWDPQWAETDSVLYYLETAGDILVSDVVMDEGCAAPPPRRLFNARIGEPRTSRNHYAYSPSIQRFLINSRIADPRTQTLGVLINWTAAVGAAAR